MQRDKYPDPFSKEINLETSCLESCVITEQSHVKVKNGLVLELAAFASKTNLPSRKVANWIQQLVPTSCQGYTLKTFESKISRTVETDKKFQKKKKHQVFRCKQEFENAFFFQNQPDTSKHEKNWPETLERPDVALNYHSIHYTVVTNSQTSCANSKKDFTTLNLKNNGACSQQTERDDLNKRVNLIKYEIIKEQKKLAVLEKLVQAEKDKLSNLKSVNGHFSVRNVTKRDENACNTSKKLNTALSLQSKLQLEIMKLMEEKYRIRLKN